MKTLATLLLVGLTTIAANANPSWGFTLGNGAGFYWNSGGRSSNYYAPVVMPRQVYIKGPQYYEVRGLSSCGAHRVINYTDAPIVVRHNNGGHTTIPKTWNCTWD